MSKKKSPDKKNTIVFMPGNTICAFDGTPTILEVAIENNIPLNHSCGGMGSCTTCKVFVQKGAKRLPPPEDVEAEHARMRGFHSYERLACQVKALDGLVLEIPKPIK